MMVTTLNINSTASSPLNLVMDAYDFPTSQWNDRDSFDSGGKSFIRFQDQIIEIDLGEEWFYTDEWQAGEKEVDAYIEAGEYEEFESFDEMFDAIEEKYA